MIVWVGIVICLFHSALFSGLNLGLFGISRLRLAVQSDSKNSDAERILNLRRDTHLLLATLLWGNVASNVLLALFSESVLAGIWAFLFSTFAITFLGEILPQAYLAKNTLKASRILVPIVKIYQILFYPIAKPTALLLDAWLGKEKITYFQEDELEVLLSKHGNSDRTNLEMLETKGAINFLQIDDTPLLKEGENIHPKSIISLPLNHLGQIQMPKYDRSLQDPFLKAVNASGKKWVILLNKQNFPCLILNADHFLRECLYKKKHMPFSHFCHKPVVVTNPKELIGESILKLNVSPKHKKGDVVDNDVILYWGEQKRIITGADILGRLLSGII